MKENSVDTGFERFAFRIQQWQLFVLLYNLRFLKFLIRFQREILSLEPKALVKEH